MNAVLAASRRSHAPAPFFIQLSSTARGDKSIWTIRLEPEMLTLIGPKNNEVLQAHRDEVARYVRFNRDLVHGHMLHFTIIEGMKSYTLKCTKLQTEKLLAWMPHKSTIEVERNVRRSGVIMCLLGVLHLVVMQRIWMGAGTLLMAIGAFGLYRPRRNMHAFNGVALLITGLWDLATWSFIAGDSSGSMLTYCLVPIVTGIAFIVCGLQQLYMLSPNEHVRVACAMRDERAALVLQQSHVVKIIAELNLVAGGLFGSYAIALVLLTQFGGGNPVAGLAIAGAKPDLIVFGVVSLLALVSAVVLLYRARPAYAEAKVSAQVLLGVAVFAVWGMIFSMVTGSGFSFFDDVVYTNHVIYAPSVWVSLITAVVFFNRWFDKAVDRELEHQRD